MHFFQFLFIITTISTTNPEVLTRKQFIDSFSQACSIESWIFQLYKTNEEDGSKVCTDTNEFIITGNDGYKFDKEIKRVQSNKCDSSSQCNSDEYCVSEKCAKKNNACLNTNVPRVKCHLYCPSSICVKTDPKEVYCCPLNITNKILTFRKCFVDEDCGPKQICKTNNLGEAHCENKESSIEDFFEPDIDKVHKKFREIPLSNFWRENNSCDTEALKSFKPSALCPGDLIPIGHEQKCFGTVIGDDSSGRCLHPAGICYRGYCCPKVHLNSDTTKPYLSRVDCDPNCPLPSNWLYGFCDPVKRKIAFIGLELLYSKDKLKDTAWRKPDSCKINSDCQENKVCVTLERMNTSTETIISSFECWNNPLRPPTPPSSWKSFLYIFVFLCLTLLFVFSNHNNGTVRK